MSMENSTDESKSDWWWVDYVEGEVEGDLKKDMELLLDVAPRNWKAVEEIQLTRDLIKTIDPTDILIKKWDQKKCKSKIMEGIDLLSETSIRPQI